MNNKMDIKFQKWETKQRKKMGDLEFCKKYIQLYKQINKIHKILFPLCAFVSFGLAVQRIIIACINPIMNNILFAFVSLALTLTWIFFTQMYFLHISYSLCGRRIEKWETELKQITNG